MHGVIMVNDEPIGRWTAGRLTTVKETGKVAPYRCTVTLLPNYDVHGKFWPMREWEGEIEHEVGLGALSLMTALLQAAETDFRERGIY